MLYDDKACNSIQEPTNTKVDHIVLPDLGPGDVKNDSELLRE